MQLPFLPYNDWTETRITLHLILQIIGKVRLAASPRKNHWWGITQYVSSKGFSTHSIPLSDGLNTFEITVNIHKKAVQFDSSTGETIELKLKNGYSVAAFYKDTMTILHNWGLNPQFIHRPLDMGIDKNFDQITEYHHYDWQSIHTFWQMMLWNDGVFKTFSGRSYSKTCPVHIYWHHMDLTVTRFSGKPGPPMNPNARILEKDAYSHEVISFGFWAGDDNMTEPAYYSYTYPSPDGLDQEKLWPKQSFWIEANGSPMAILKYADVVATSNPTQMVLDFLESAYIAGAKLAGWDIEALTVPALAEL